jgi:hypothetical protein
MGATCREGSRLRDCEQSTIQSHRAAPEAGTAETALQPADIPVRGCYDSHVVYLEWVRRRSETVVHQLRTQSLARVERARRRRVMHVSALAVAMLASLIGYGGFETYRKQAREQALAAESAAREASARDDRVRKLAALETEVNEKIARAEAEAERSEIRIQHQGSAKWLRHRAAHERQISCP